MRRSRRVALGAERSEIGRELGYRYPPAGQNLIRSVPDYETPSCRMLTPCGDLNCEIIEGRLEQFDIRV